MKSTRRMGIRMKNGPKKVRGSNRTSGILRRAQGKTVEGGQERSPGGAVRAKGTSCILRFCIRICTILRK